MSKVRTTARSCSLLMSFGLAFAFASAMSSASYGQGQDVDASVDAEGGRKNSSAGSDEARRLVEALGSDSYATRLRARDKLKRMGLEAVDVLRRASTDLDSEIALSAQSIVASYAIVWFTSEDPDSVRDLLVGYGAKSISERQARISMLAELPDRSGLAALVRIARFESSTGLSRRAAIEVMEQTTDRDPAKRRANAAVIQKGLGLVERQATEWLQVYANDLISGQYSADKWRDLVRKQRDAVDSLASEEITRASVLGLVRICAVRAALMGNRDEGLRLAVENADLVPVTTNDLVEASNWASENQLHAAVVALYAKNRPMFERSSVLLYGYAFALKAEGDADEATRVADKAYQLSSFTGGKDAVTKMQPKEAEEVAKLRREIASSLRERGMFEWAEREFKGVIESISMTNLDSVLCRSDLSIMYGELERHQDVIDLLEPLTERMEKDDEFKAKVTGNPSLASIARRWAARVKYHRALLDLGKVADSETEQEAMNESVRQRMMSAFLGDTRDIDVLIKMYRMDGDEDWRNAVKVQLSRAKQVSMQEIKNLDAMMVPGRVIPQAEMRLAEALNNYAWLVCNTEGDLKEALQFSLRSLKITEDSAKLDTCARCYFAVGDLDSAIRMQQRALKLDPYSPPLKRQLREFQQAKQKADAGSAAGETGKTKAN